MGMGSGSQALVALTFTLDEFQRLATGVFEVGGITGPLRHCGTVTDWLLGVKKRSRGATCVVLSVSRDEGLSTTFP
jgi:hypothetical protein